MISLLKNLITKFNKANKKKLRAKLSVPAQMNHIPITFLEGLYFVLKSRKACQKLKENFYAEKLIFLAAIPKSASSNIGARIARISGLKRSYASYMLENQTSNLNPELMMDFLNGGVLKYHFQPSSENLMIMHLLGSRYFVLLRHPADVLCAAFAHLQKELKYPDRTNDCVHILKSDALWPTALFLIDLNKFKAGTSLEEGLKYLIIEGFLYANLTFMVEWLRVRSKERSMAITYENYMLQRESFYKKIAEFLNIPFDEKLMLQLDLDQSHDLDHVSLNEYPYGYPGKVGAWKTFFSEEIKVLYNKTIDSFLNYYPKAELLLQVYPQLKVE
ncbi:MAG: hypothetical protein A3E87_05220 [Gammaproteobacteria bacterium RIFCSPHIGHO2_12_FULL_35_23]|nr:MAG: hypothetical protein A3E87_05220 [Gammaproteobacteria bacterium RIFCSPHIGHO2_12_FULL_35_23]